MFDTQEEIESILIKAITYSDENLLKQTLKIYKSQEIKLNDANILHHAVKLAKVKVIFEKITLSHPNPVLTWFLSAQT